MTCHKPKPGDSLPGLTSGPAGHAERESWAAASDDRREAGGAYSIAFPIDKVLVQFPGKIIVKPGESYS
jgi:hypothetical protein